MQTASKLQLDSRVVGEMSAKISMAVELLSTEQGLRIFQAVEDGHGRASGWNIVRNTAMQADEALLLLTKLKDLGVINSTDAGLDGFYYLTQLGFALRSGLRVAV